MDLAEKLKAFSAQHVAEELIKRDDKILFVDGTNSFLRCHAATPTMNDDGDHVGGMTGFLRSIGLAIRQLKPSRCVIVFDGKGGSQKRRTLFKDYKSNRKSMTKLNRTYDFNSIEDEVDSRKLQLFKLIETLMLLPITVIAPDNVEADDVLAYLANLTVSRGGAAIIMSTDKDFLQLINDHITVFNPIKKKIYNCANVVEEYGIHPNNFIIYRTIDGDDSDNIPGVKGVGKATLLKHFPELADETIVAWDHIFASAENKDNKACKLILDNKQLLERNVELMRLDEQQMSGNIKMQVLNQFDGDINELNKLHLTQAFVRDKLINAFPNLDEWIMSTFGSLNRFSKKG